MKKPIMNKAGAVIHSFPMRLFAERRLSPCANELLLVSHNDLLLIELKLSRKQK